MFCEKHGIEYDGEVKEFFGKEICVGLCPECQREIEEQEARSRERKDWEVRDKLKKSCNIEPMYYNSEIGKIKEKDGTQRKALDIIKKIVDNRKGKVVFLGGHGTGKTFLAVAAVWALRGAIYSMFELGSMIRECYTSGESELKKLDYFAGLPILAIDEIGRTKNSTAEMNWLSYIIDKRHVRGLPLILISNKHARKSCKKAGCEECLENYIGEDVMSRLREDAYLIDFQGEDYRTRRRQGE